MKIVSFLFLITLFIGAEAQTVNLLAGSGFNITRSYVRTADFHKRSGETFNKTFLTPDINILFEFTNNYQKLRALSFKSGIYFHREKYSSKFWHGDVVQGVWGNVWLEMVECSSINLDFPALMSCNFVKGKKFFLDLGPYMSLMCLSKTSASDIGYKMVSAGLHTGIGFGSRKVQAYTYYKTSFNSQFRSSAPNWPNIECGKSSIIGLNLSWTIILNKKNHEGKKLS